MNLTDSLAKDVGIKPACEALVVSRAGFYRWKNPDEEKEAVVPVSPLALSLCERQQALDTFCRRTKSGLVMGYYKTQGACKVDLLLSLCHPRYLQPIHCGLDGGIQGTWNTGKKTDRTVL